MVINEITVVRIFIRNKSSTIITKIPPSYKDFWTLSIELLIKRDWRKISVVTFTSLGNTFCKSSKDLSNLPVRSRVLVLGCLVTVNNIPALPRSEASPILGALAPILTSAIFSSVMGTSSTFLITALRRASTLLVDNTPRTINSFPNSYKTPPAAFWFISFTTSMTSFKPIP